MSQKPLTYIADLAHLPKALERIIGLKRWVVWRWELRTNKDGSEKWTKPPYQCSYPGVSAKNNDPNTWGSYEEAVAAVAAGLADGIGFMLRDAEVAAADLDHVRDAQTGEIVDWAKQLCVEADELGLYREVTVSGSGLRFIGLLQKPPTYFIKFTNGERSLDFPTREEAERELEAFVAAGRKREQLSVHATNEIHRKFTRNNGTGIELYRNCARYITISGLQEGSQENMGPIGDYLDELLARFDRKPIVVTPSVLDFNTAGPQADYYRDLIENGAPVGERSEKFQEVVWHLASMGWTIEQIVGELAKYPNGIGLKYANRLFTEVERSFEKWRSQRRASVIGTSAAGTSAAGASAASASAAGASGIGSPWPQIYVRAGELPRIVGEAENALISLGHDIYQRGGKLVRPVLTLIKTSGDREFRGWRLIDVTRPYLVKELCWAAQFLRYDGRAKKFVVIDAPDKVAEVYLHNQGGWKLPRIAGFATAPFLHADGTVHDREGYDPVSGLLCKWEQNFPPIPLTPSKAEAEAALAELKEPLAEFPFVTPADKAAALSAMLTAIDRRGMDVAPLHAFTAPEAGTGKGLLVNVIATITTGKPVSVIDQSRRDDEFTKGFGAELLSGASLIAIDNCQHVLEGSLLNIAITQPVFGVRVLGLSQNIEVINNATIFANGNNLTIGADMTRRVILCEMDAKMERPETREFKDDHLLETVKANRAKLIVAALTVLRAWHIARPNTGLRLQSLDFKEWSQRVREALVWLGEDDPGSTMEKARADDPYRMARSAVFTEWHKVFDEKPVLVRDVIGTAFNHPDFHTALMAIAGARTGKEISPERLGKWLAKNKGSIVDDLTLARAGGTQGSFPLWQIQKC